MTRWAPRKADVLDALAAEILQQNSKGRVIVAIDAREPAQAERFATELAAAIARTSHAVFVATLDDFRQPRELDGDYDYSLLQRVLLDPFQLSVSTGFVLAGFDAARNQPFEPKWSTGPKDAILLLAGEYLLTTELRGQWNYAIWLDDGLADPKSAYHRSAKPRQAAIAIIDNADVEHPRRVFADAC